MIYLAIASDFDENLQPFWFLKPGMSDKPTRRMKDLRMTLLKAWDCYWLETCTIGMRDREGYWIMLDTWIQMQISATYPKGAKKFSGYTEAIGRYYSTAECLNAARDLIACADALPRRYATSRDSTERPAYLQSPSYIVPIGLMG